MGRNRAAKIAAAIMIRLKIGINTATATTPAASVLEVDDESEPELLELDELLSLLLS